MSISKKINIEKGYATWVRGIVETITPMIFRYTFEGGMMKSEYVCGVVYYLTPLELWTRRKWSNNEYSSKATFGGVKLK